MTRRMLTLAALTLVGIVGLVAIPRADEDDPPFAHVLLISIDGLHASDLDGWVASRPDSALAALSASGRTYTNATATKPSDSFPGLLAMITGGTPRSTGVFYDDAWDRSLAAASGACTAGARLRWKQTLDATPLAYASWDAYLAVVNGSGSALAETKLPRVPPDCVARVFPHMYPRVNNVFEIVRGMGGRTAWSDKHPSYEFVKGPSGQGLDELYAPEIAATIGGTLITDNFALTMAYDDLKVQAVVNQIHGFDHSGTTVVGSPTLFGMNFQAVSVGQKLSQVGGPVGGYDANGAPSAALTTTLDHTDQSIRSMLTALGQEGLLDSTLIIVSAKHGNSPMRTPTLHRVDSNAINAIVNAVTPVALVSADTGPLIWLQDQSRTADVVAALDTAVSRAALNLPAEGGILSGPELAALFGDPTTDPRVPDIVLIPQPGTLYSLSATKIADHGSFNEEDVHVALLVSNAHMPSKTIDDPVETRQIACTILKGLGGDCAALQSQQLEPSTFLPHSNHVKAAASTVQVNKNR